MNESIEYAIKNLGNSKSDICKGFVSNRAPFYPGKFPKEFFTKDFFFIGSRDDFNFVKSYIGPNIENTMEIGVDGGNYSRKIVNELRPKTHYCVDPYCKYDHPHSHSWPQDKIDELYNNLINKVFKEEIQNESVKVIKKFSYEAMKNFDDKIFDFIYIDGNHWFEYVNQDLEEASRIIKDNGIIAGHDFHGDVPAAVYNLCSQSDFKLKSLALDKLKDGRLCPSFYLVKED